MVKRTALGLLLGALALPLAQTAWGYVDPATSPTAGVSFSAAHFGQCNGVCAVGIGRSAVPAETVAWLGRSGGADRRGSLFRVALSAHGRLHQPLRYRTDAVYFVQPGWLSALVDDGLPGQWQFAMFVHTVTATAVDGKFASELLYDLQSGRPADYVDAVMLVEVDAQGHAADHLPAPYDSAFGSQAMSASIGAVQHAMAAAKAGMERLGNGFDYGAGARGPFSGVFSPSEGQYASWPEPYGTLTPSSQQDPEGGGTAQFGSAPEPGSLAIFGGLSMLALWAARLRKGKRKPRHGVPTGC